VEKPRHEAEGIPHKPEADISQPDLQVVNRWPGAGPGNAIACFRDMRMGTAARLRIVSGDGADTDVIALRYAQDFTEQTKLLRAVYAITEQESFIGRCTQPRHMEN